MRALLVQSAWCILRLRGGSDPIKVWADALDAARVLRAALGAIAASRGDRSPRGLSSAEARHALAVVRVIQR
jgi:hypothetical protein